MVDAIDAVKILGSLLGNGALSKGSGGSVLGSLVGAALGGSSQQKTQGGGALGDVLGGLLGGKQSSSGNMGGLGDLIGAAMGGGNRSGGGALGSVLGGLLGGGQAKSGGGMADMLGGMLGGAQKKSGGGMSDILGGLLGGSKSSSSGSGDILGSLLGGGSSNKGGLGGSGGLGGLLGAAVTKYAQSESKDAPDPDHANCDHLPFGVDQNQATDDATLIIRAMINAAKSDGSIDKAEQEAILAKLGKISQAESNFIRSEFAAPLDVAGFARSIPKAMGPQIYAVSLMAIDLDTNKEAHYLHDLAQGLGISQQNANKIHEHLGAQKLYA